MALHVDDFRTLREARDAVARGWPRGLRYGDIRLGDEYGHQTPVPQRAVDAGIRMLVKTLKRAYYLGYVRIYREILVANAQQIRLDDIGTYWALTRELAISYLGREGLPHCVQASAAHEDIDWDATFLRAVENPDVEEVILKPGTVVDIECLWVANKSRKKWLRKQPPARTAQVRVV